jgi:hypothetical protein
MAKKSSDYCAQNGRNHRRATHFTGETSRTDGPTDAVTRALSPLWGSEIREPAATSTSILSRGRRAVVASHHGEYERNGCPLSVGRGNRLLSIDARIVPFCEITSGDACMISPSVRSRAPIRMRRCATLRLGARAHAQDNAIRRTDCRKISRRCRNRQSGGNLTLCLVGQTGMRICRIQFVVRGVLS